MSIKGYRQVMEVTLVASLPMSSEEGDMAFCEEDKHYYVFRNGEWVQIPTQPEVQEWLDWKANIADISAVGFSGDYDDLNDKPTIPSGQVNSDWNSSTGVSRILNKPTLSTVATSGSYNDLSSKPTIPSPQVQSDWSQTNSGAIDFIKNKPANRSQSSATRSLNTVYQISTTRDSYVVYSCSISNTVSLSGGSSGGVILEIATNAGFTTGVQELTRISNSNTGTLVLGLVLNDSVTNSLKGYVPAGYYVRLRTFNTIGTPTYTYVSGQEVWL